MPQRIQRKRLKGWRMPPGVVYVGRPTFWGNPFKDAESFRAWLIDDQADVHQERRTAILRDVGQLRGKDLCCWCPPDRKCHADVLLELANPKRDN